MREYVDFKEEMKDPSFGVRRCILRQTMNGILMQFASSSTLRKLPHPPLDPEMVIPWIPETRPVRREPLLIHHHQHRQMMRVMLRMFRPQGQFADGLRRRTIDWRS
jgi:hypothetical protein